MGVIDICMRLFLLQLTVMSRFSASLTAFGRTLRLPSMALVFRLCVLTKDPEELPRHLEVHRFPHCVCGKRMRDGVHLHYLQ